MAVTPPKAKPPPSTPANGTRVSSIDRTLGLIPGPGPFTMSSLATLYHTSTLAEGFSNNERQAAARALLRHNAHLDGTHYHTRRPGGLHPAYVAFNRTDSTSKERSLTHTELVEAALKNLFDAVSLGFRVFVLKFHILFR
jgi:hypothetical protein